MLLLSRAVHLRTTRIRSETEIPILVVASQLTPLHWGKIMPGETWNEGNKACNMGKVWFTVSVAAYDEKEEPTPAAVALRLAAITVAFVVPISTIAAIVVSSASAFTSVLGVKMDGVYADGKLLICRGMAHSDGVYSLALKTEDEIKKLSKAAEANKTTAAASTFSSFS